LRVRLDAVVSAEAYETTALDDEQERGRTSAHACFALAEQAAEKAGCSFGAVVSVWSL
jgi:hypothetical protein